MSRFKLQVISSPRRGRGIFASERIPAQSLIESAPVTELEPEISRTIIERGSGDLFLAWREADDKVVTLAFAAGLLMICNHDSDRPNAQLRKDYLGRIAELWSTSDIQSGEEILISYRKYRL
jgi:SET domain-containing protein